MTARFAALVGTFALASTSALADEPERDNGQPKQPPTRKEKQRMVEAATAAGAVKGKEALGDRGPPKPEKSWEEMTPSEKDAARKRWLLNSGDFGPPGGGSRSAAPNSERPTKDRGAVILGPPAKPSDKTPAK